MTKFDEYGNYGENNPPLPDPWGQWFEGVESYDNPEAWREQRIEELDTTGLEQGSVSLILMVIFGSVVSVCVAGGLAWWFW